MEPAYKEPAYKESAYKEPAYKESAYKEPAYKESAYKDSANKELLFIRNIFSFPNLYQETSPLYTFIRNSGYKEHIFMVPISSLKADFTV